MTKKNDRKSFFELKKKNYRKSFFERPKKGQFGHNVGKDILVKIVAANFKSGMGQMTEMPQRKTTALQCGSFCCDLTLVTLGHFKGLQLFDLSPRVSKLRPAIQIQPRSHFIRPQRIFVKN